MCGSATFAMEVSRTSIKAANATVAAISHGFAFGFHRSLLPASITMPILFLLSPPLHHDADVIPLPLAAGVNSTTDRGCNCLNFRSEGDEPGYSCQPPPSAL